MAETINEPAIPTVDVRLANAIRELQDNEQDLVICVDGLEGSGKSTLAVETCQSVDPGFSMERVVYSNEAFRALLENDHPIAICVDEAVLTSWNIEWATKQQRRTNKLLTLYREKRHISMLVIPSIYKLNPYLRNDRVGVRIYVPYRGLAMVYTKPPLPGLKDPWRQKEWESVGVWWKAGYTKQALVARLRKIPGYTFEFHFPPLPQATHAEYRARRKAGLSEEEDIRAAGGEKAEKWLPVVHSAVAMLEDAGQSEEEIARGFGVSVETLRGWVLAAREV